MYYTAQREKNGVGCSAEDARDGPVIALVVSFVGPRFTLTSFGPSFPRFLLSYFSHLARRPPARARMRSGATCVLCHARNTGRADTLRATPDFVAARASAPPFSACF